MKEQAQYWAIVPARGGSKGIPKKNIKELAGKPLIAWTIETLQKTGVFSNIIVSTDCLEIANVARSFGADVEMRTSLEESDSFTMPDIPVHSCLLARKKNTTLPSHVFMVQCTSPFVKESRYREAVEISLKNPNSTIFSVKDSHSFLWRRPKGGEIVEPLGHPFGKRLGRQYLNYEQYQETGSFYCMETKSFLESKHRFNNSAIPVKLGDFESLDIDSKADWELAEYFIKKGVLT